MIDHIDRSPNTRGRRAALAGLVLILVAGVVAACGGSGSTPGTAQAEACEGSTLLDEIKDRGVLRVAAGTGPPNTFPDAKTGEWLGSDSQILGAAAKRIGVEVKANFASVAAMIPAIQFGRADVTSGLFKNEERAKVAAFSIAFKWAVDNVYVAKDDASINSVQDLNGKTLGAASGTAELVAANAMVENGFAEKVVVAQHAPGPFDLLADGRVDAIVMQSVTAAYARHRNPSRYDFKAAFAVDPKLYDQKTVTASHYLVKKSPCSSTLLKALNDNIRALRASGEMAKIYRRYGVTDPAVYTPPPNWKG